MPRHPENQTGPRRWKAALYIRLSREDGNDVSLSVLNQQRLLTDYLGRHRDEFEPAGVYIDDGFTGTDSERDAFQRLLRDIRTGAADCVVVKDPSRLSRNYIEAGHYMEQLFVNLDVRFISLELPALDSYRRPEQMNSIIVPIQNVINDDFCRQTSIKVRGILNMKRAAGEFIGAFAPYGYRKSAADRHRLEIDAEAAEVVRRIFSWFVREGMSKRGIARRLNRLGVPNPSAYKRLHGLRYHNPSTDCNDGLWSPGTVSRILKNPVYAGQMVQGRSRIRSYKVHTQVAVPPQNWFVVPGTHRPVVDPATFECAQTAAGLPLRAAPGRTAVYLFAGFVRCAGCGKAMTRRTAKGHVYYACRTHAEKSDDRCTRHGIRAEDLERAVLAAVRTLVAALDTESIRQAVRRAPAGTGRAGRLAHMLAQRSRELGRVTAASDSLYADWKSGDITREEYHRLKAGFADRAEKLRRAVRSLREETRAGGSAPPDAPALEDFMATGNFPSLDRGLLTALVRAVYVEADGGLRVDFTCRAPVTRADP